VHKTIYTLAFIAGFIALFFPTLTSASSVPSGSVIKASDSPDIHYVATNGKRYKFEDPETFLSWYDSFTVVKTISPETMQQIPDSNAAITVRPAVRLINFEGSNRVYVVAEGANLRWIKKEAVARELYGKNWSRNIIKISVDQVQNYTFGQPLERASDYNVFSIKENSLSPNAELVKRGLVEVGRTQIVQIQTPAETVATLSDIKENISGKLSPKFNAHLYQYRLDASADETSVEITPFTKNATTLMVNGIPTRNGAPVKIQLTSGSQVITVSALNRNGESTDYRITIYKRYATDGDAHLSSLKEDLEDNFGPVSFNPNHFEYQLLARYPEEILRLTPKAVSGNATIKINGIAVRSGATLEIPLERGETDIRIYVIDGDRRLVYTVKVIRQKYLSNDRARLEKLNTELNTLGEMSFESSIKDYYLDVDKNKTSITLDATVVAKDARLFVNDTEVGLKKRKGKSTHRLYAGTTVIELKVLSAEGATFTYRVHVNRVL